MLQERVSTNYSRFDNLNEDNIEELYATTAADKASVDYSKFDTTVQAQNAEDKANEPRKLNLFLDHLELSFYVRQHRNASMMKKATSCATALKMCTRQVLC